MYPNLSRREYPPLLEVSERSKGGGQCGQNAFKERGNLFTDGSSLWLNCNYQDVPLQFLIIELIPLRPPKGKRKDSNNSYSLNYIFSSEYRERRRGGGVLLFFF